MRFPPLMITVPAPSPPMLRSPTKPPPTSSEPPVDIINVPVSVRPAPSRRLLMVPAYGALLDAIPPLLMNPTSPDPGATAPTQLEPVPMSPWFPAARFQEMSVARAIPGAINPAAESRIASTQVRRLEDPRLEIRGVRFIGRMLQPARGASINFRCRRNLLWPCYHRPDSPRVKHRIRSWRTDRGECPSSSPAPKRQREMA